MTIVTIAFNSQKTLLRTVESVAAQTYPRIEYIVIDGGSTDATLELLRQRNEDIDLWLSEPDGGISDALNKGIALAKGEFIALVNADDWIEPQHIERAIDHLRRSEAGFVFGDRIVHGEDGTVRYIVAGDPNYTNHIRHAMKDVNHPSVVCRRELYERCGLFDRGLRIAMDYDWLLRCHCAGNRGDYVPGMASHVSDEGVSHRNAGKGLAEVRAISIRHGYPAAAAWLRFITRIIKLNIRRFTAHWISDSLAHRLRALVHGNYKPVGSRNISTRQQ